MGRPIKDIPTEILDAILDTAGERRLAQNRTSKLNSFDRISAFRLAAHSLRLFLSLHCPLRCSNPLILLSSFSFLYSSTLSSHLHPAHLSYLYTPSLSAHSTILSKWPYHLKVLHFTLSTTPHIIPSPLTNIPNLLYTRSLYSSSIHLAPQAFLRYLISTVWIPDLCLSFHTQVSFA